jgi:hypothetical protein
MRPRAAQSCVACPRSGARACAVRPGRAQPGARRRVSHSSTTDDETAYFPLSQLGARAGESGRARVSTAHGGRAHRHNGARGGVDNSPCSFRAPAIVRAVFGCAGLAFRVEVSAGTGRRSSEDPRDEGSAGDGPSAMAWRRAWRERRARWRVGVVRAERLCFFKVRPTLFSRAPSFCSSHLRRPSLPPPQRPPMSRALFREDGSGSVSLVASLVVRTVGDKRARNRVGRAGFTLPTCNAATHRRPRTAREPSSRCRDSRGSCKSATAAPSLVVSTRTRWKARTQHSLFARALPCSLSEPLAGRRRLRAPRAPRLCRLRADDSAGPPRPRGASGAPGVARLRSRACRPRP